MDRGSADNCDCSDQLIVHHLRYGAHLTESLRAWEYAWARLAVLEILPFVLFGALTGLRMRAIRRHALGNKATSQWSALTQSPFFKISLGARIWIVLGTILLTVTKPGLQESLVIVAGSLVLGLLFSLVSFGRRSVLQRLRPPHAASDA